MTDRQHHAKKDPHKSLVSNYLKKIIKNEETSRDLKTQVGDIRKMYHDILEISSTYEDSTCCYELVTSPVYANYLASWDGEEERKLGSPEHGKDLYQLQSIVEKQNNKIGKLKTQVMEMRECFQIMLHNLAKDKDNTRILSVYLENTCPEMKATANNAYASEELQHLRNENQALRAKLQTITENADPYSPSPGPVYNIYGPKEVLIQSTKNVCIRKGSLTSTGSSSCATIISSSTNSSPVVYRTRVSDDHEQQKVKLLETERWTQNIQREQRSQSPLDKPVTDETQPKLIRGSVVQEEISVTTVEYRGRHMVDLRGGHDNLSQTVDCHAEIEQISEILHEENEDTINQSKEMIPKYVVPTRNNRIPVQYPTRVSPEGSSLCTDSPTATSALLGMLFTGFCDINAAGSGRDTAFTDLDKLPSTFLEVLKRIRIICRSDYGKLLKELGVEPVDSSKPLCDVCNIEQECDVSDITDSHDVTRTCSGDVDAPVSSCIETELRMLNTVIQTWLKDQSEHHDRDTLPHMKMIKILNCYQNQTYWSRVPVAQQDLGPEVFV